MSLYDTPTLLPLVSSRARKRDIAERLVEKVRAHCESKIWRRRYLFIASNIPVVVVVVQIMVRGVSGAKVRSIVCHSQSVHSVDENPINYPSKSGAFKHKAANEYISSFHAGARDIIAVTREKMYIKFHRFSRSFFSLLLLSVRSSSVHSADHNSNDVLEGE
jgi:hypothetical protein